MTALFSIAVVIGLASIVTWAALVVLATAVEGWHGLDPERRFGPRGRSILAAITGFGMGGMSATFAGWSAGPALIAAVAGAIVMAVAAVRLGPHSGPN